MVGGLSFVSTFVRRSRVATTRDRFHTLFKIVHVFFEYLNCAYCIRECLKYVYCIHVSIFVRCRYIATMIDFIHYLKSYRCFFKYLKYAHCIRDCLMYIYCILEYFKVRILYSRLFKVRILYSRLC